MGTVGAASYPHLVTAISIDVTDPDLVVSLLAPQAVEELHGDQARCALYVGRVGWPGRQCGNDAVVEGGAPNTDLSFRVCAEHAHLVADPRPLTP